MIHAAADLRRRAYGSGGVEKVNLQGDSKMSPFSADDVVLVAGGENGRLELSVRSEPYIEGLALKDNGSRQYCLPGLIERTSREG